ncbi:MAG: hypothetical protein IPG22_00550 [Acidobacteria bacterium]|nr:hypothetical protein [Acidobacteriota bacterium]
MDIQQLIETWQINNRINLYLLDAIAPEHLADGLSSKGRNVGEQFAHIHNVRLMWLKASMPEELAGQAKVEKGKCRRQGAPRTLARAVRRGDRQASRICRLERRTGQRIQTARHGFRRISYRPRCTSSVADHHRSQAIRPSARQENSLRHLGMGSKKCISVAVTFCVFSLFAKLYQKLPHKKCESIHTFAKASAETPINTGFQRSAPSRSGQKPGVRW